jgi:hypothetical protein
LHLSAARPSGLALTALLLLVPGAFYVWTPVRWELNHVTPAGGDEPHYLMIADAVVRDHHLRVSRAYARDAVEKRIFGPIDWQNHSQAGPHGVFSIHGIGVSLLVAPLFAWFGIAGARLTLGLLAAVIPFLFWRIARLCGLGRYESAALAFCASFGLPFLLASGQIYPDLVSGVVLLALVAVAVQASAGEVRSRSAALAGCLLALLPWLHIKNVVPAVAVGATIVLLQLTRERRQPALSWVGSVVMPLGVSLGLLAWYHAYALGSLAGPYAAGQPSAGATLRQAGMIVLGLHFDQAQGVFVQQPLFLACRELCSWRAAIGCWLRVFSRRASGWSSRTHSTSAGTAAFRCPAGSCGPFRPCGSFR